MSISRFFRKMTQIGIWIHSERKRETKEKEYSTQTECVVRLILPVVQPATSESQLIRPIIKGVPSISHTGQKALHFSLCPVTTVSHCPPMRVSLVVHTAACKR